MVVFLLIHIILCMIAWILLRTGVLAGTRKIFPIVCLVPVWGFCALFVLELHSCREHGKGTETGVEKLLVEDEVQKSIYVDENTMHSTVAPLNEVLAMNDSRTRRELIMEVLYENPGDYIKPLQMASVNDDTEVVHYAVTALVELQKDYDLRFQSIERRLTEHAEDENLKREYLELLEEYLDSGLAEGNSRIVYLKRYSDLLSQKIEKEESFSVYLKKVKADMELKEYDNVYRMVTGMIQNWPDRETGYLKMIEYYATKKDRTGIDRILAVIRERNVYLSPKGRSIVKFWQKQTEDQPNAFF